MKIKTAIDRVYAVRPDSFTPDEKVEWLNHLDGQIYQEVILTHENPQNISFSKYDASDLEKELLIPFPYDKIYTSYLKMMIEEAYGETEAYNNALYLYNENKKDFLSYWNRTYRPLPAGRKKVSHCGALFVYSCESPLDTEGEK